LISANDIATVGFPIVMCCWFMVRMEKVINNNTRAMEETAIVLEKYKYDESIKK